MTDYDLPARLLAGLTDQQAAAVRSSSRRLLLIAGAGSGKTEVMARRVAWWVGVEGVPKDRVVAFTFTDRAAEEMKFRIRQHIQAITPEDGDATLGGMYIGTIHSYCLKLLRELRPDLYHNYDIVDDIARVALVQRCYDYLLGLRGFQNALSIDFPVSRSRTIEQFLTNPSSDEIDVQVQNVSLSELAKPPYKASVTFQKVYYSPGTRTERQRETYVAQVDFGLRERVPNEFVRVNPLGLQIAYFRVDQAFQEGRR